MNFFHALWRAIKAAGVFAVELTMLAIQRPETRAARAAWLSGFCRHMLKTVDVHVFTHGPIAMKGAVISNHLSFLDILTQASLRPAVFVSNAGVAKLPLLGWIAKHAGTVFVERGGTGSADAAAQTMEEDFRDGLPIIFFPEGTTGSGEEPLMPFKSGLLYASMHAGEPVTPSFIRYKLADEDIRAGRTARHALYWQEQTLPQLIWRLCQLHRIDVHIRFAEEPVTFSEAALADRKVAAVEAHDTAAKLIEAPLI